MLPDETKAGGLLAAGFEDGRFAPLEWVDVPVGDLIVTVAADALKVDLDGELLRLPVSYLEAIGILRALDCISPTYEMCVAMHQHAKHRPQYVGLWQSTADDARMGTLGFSRTFNARLEEKLTGREAGELIFGPWKVWLLNPLLVKKGAVNHGFWDQTKKPAEPIQKQGAAHDNLHYDYSQVLQPVKRWARTKNGDKLVDLLHWTGITKYIPARYLTPYELVAPETLRAASRGSASLESAGIRETADANGIDLQRALTAAGLDVAAQPNWKTRGAADFAPQGIMLHHTAGARTGDAPSLGTCVNGRPDVSGPLCHLLIARSGKVHLIAGRRANHAGPGAAEVLAKLLAGEDIEGDAVTHGYVDGASGGPSFYGIEVENDGVGEEYPDVQITALVKACAAICREYGWDSRRIVHHRQWTRRKIDMSYKGDIRTAVDAEILL